MLRPSVVERSPRYFLNVIVTLCDKDGQNAKRSRYRRLNLPRLGMPVMLYACGSMA